MAGYDINKQRTVYLKVVVDESFRYCEEGWKQLIKDIVKEASKQFNSQFRIKLKIKKIEEIETRRFPDVVSKIEWLKENIDPDNCDIVVCFDGRNYGLYVLLVEGCVDEISGRWALLIYPRYDLRKKSYDILYNNFIHEIGHLFGARHVHQSDSFMYYTTCSSFSLKFDKTTKSIILRHKWRKFKATKKH